MIGMKVDIIQIVGMRLHYRITIIIGMIIGERIVMIRVEMRIDKTIIKGMIAMIRSKITHHLGKMVTDNNIEGIVIRKTANIIIGHQAKLLISQTHLGNFSMIHREKALISTKLDIHNINLVKPVVHQFRIATFVGKMVIMQINVQLETREKHMLLIWWSRKFSS